MGAEDAFGEGVKFMLIDRLDKAQTSFERAVELEPNNAASRYKLAEVLLKLNKLPEAEVQAAKAVEIDQNNPYYYQLLATLQAKQGKRNEAIKVLKKLIKRYPTEPDYYYPLAEAFLAEKKYDDAVDVLNQLEKQVGRNEELTRQKQQILLSENKLGAAIKEGEELIKQMPDEPQFMLYQAELLINNNQPEKAKLWLQKVQQIAPDNGYARLLMYEIYRFEKKYPEANTELEMALKNPDVNIDDKVSLMRPYMLGTSDSAESNKRIGYAEAIVMAHPLEAKAFALLGDFNNLADLKRPARTAYIKSTQLPGATLAVWQEIIRLDADLDEVDSLLKHSTAASELFPTQPIIWLYKGRAHLIQKQYLDATEALSQAAKLANGNNALVIEANALSGDAYHNLKQYDKSDEAYEKALKLDPDNDHVLNNYSYFLSLRKHKLSQAREMCERLMKLQPNNPTYQDTYGWVLYQLKDYKEAYIMLEKATQGPNPSAVVVEHYGDALWKAGEKEQAITQWKRAKTIGGEASPYLDRKISTKTYVD